MNFFARVSPNFPNFAKPKFWSVSEKFKFEFNLVKNGGSDNATINVNKLHD